LLGSPDAAAVTDASARGHPPPVLCARLNRLAEIGIKCQAAAAARAVAAPMMRPAALAVGLSLATAPAFADGGDRTAPLLRQGVELRREHRDQEALEVFTQALALAKTPVACAQAALAEQALGRWIDAERDLSQALASQGDAWIAKNRGALDGALAEIEGHLAWLRVEVDTASPEVQIDAEPIAVDAEVRVTAGAHVLVARASGYVPEVRPMQLSPGERAQTSFTLQPLPARPAQGETPPAAPLTPPASLVALPREVPRASGPAHSRWPMVSLGAAGALGLGVGAYFGFRTLVAKSLRDSRCAAGTCQPAALTYDSAARTSADVSTVAFGVGFACIAAAGAWWWLIDRGSPPRKAVTWHAAPMVGARLQGLGIVVEGAVE
jgi:hypothetical protein